MVKRLTTLDSARTPMATIARVWAEANTAGGSWESPVFLMAPASIRKGLRDIREKAQAVLISMLKSEGPGCPLNWRRRGHGDAQTAPRTAGRGDGFCAAPDGRARDRRPATIGGRLPQCGRGPLGRHFNAAQPDRPREPASPPSPRQIQR